MTTLRDDASVLANLVRLGKPMFENAQYLAATLEVDPEAMRRWLPAGVRLAEPARADLFCASFPQNSFGSSYLEAGLFVHVRAGGRTGIHCPWMVVDDDVALILGREAGGYPKKLARLSWEHTGDRLRASATRKGVKLVDMDVKLGAVVSDPPPFLGRPHRNVVGTLGSTWPRIVAFTPRETNVETREVDMELAFTGTDRDPLTDMGLGRIVVARLHRVNLAAPFVPPMVWPSSPLHLLRRLKPRTL